MKKKTIGFFVLILLVFVFTGCEQVIEMPDELTVTQSSTTVNIPDALSDAQAYDKEAVIVIMDELETYTLSEFDEDDMGTINDEISYYFDDCNGDFELTITLNKWVTSDGTKISGVLNFEIDHEDDVINSIDNEGYLAYEGTIVFFYETIDNTVSESNEFEFGNNKFICYSLSIDGQSIISMINLDQ